MVRILVVDDSATMRKIIKGSLLKIDGLSESNLTILEAANGQEGLDVFGAQGADIILSDWNMPEMDGLTFVKSIRAHPNGGTVPIVMITTEGTVGKMNEAIKEGANKYIIKPFTPEQLARKLRVFLKTAMESGGGSAAPDTASEQPQATDTSQPSQPQPEQSSPSSAGS